MDRYKQRHQDDPELYSLDDLQLLTDPGPHQTFKTLGSGGFGSIYLARLPKRTDTRLTPSGLVTEEKEKLIMLHDLVHGRVVGFDARLEVLDPAKTEAERYVEVAVKRLTQYSANQLGDLVNEALRLRNLWGCRNVVIVYGVILSKELESPCIVMERVHGCNLNSFLRSSYKPSLETDLQWWKTKIEIFRELVFALMLCHKQGIYHGDLKGENVLLDRFLTPKLVDFGLSFIRRRDKSYYRTFAGSLFWVSPEVYDESDGSASQELKDNPFPSDTYSLGMILVEMFLDGSIPEFLEDEFVYDKLLGGLPVPIEPREDSEEWLKRVVEEVAAISEECCSIREDRISLLQCLEKVENLYSFICDTCCNNSPELGHTTGDAANDAFCSSQQYHEMVVRFRTRFPQVPHGVLLQPSRNMIVDAEGNCLIHHFCRLDFVDGVKYIIDKAKWDFQPSRDVVEMSYICVAEGSLSVLRFLGSQWRHTVSQEVDLVHEACTHDNADILRFLVFDMKMDFSTYYETELLKPIHKLALHGRNEMIQVLLDASVSSGQDYVNTTVGLGNRYRNPNTPLQYAVEGDHPHTVKFLQQRGGKLGRRSGVGGSLAQLSWNTHTGLNLPSPATETQDIGKTFNKDLQHSIAQAVEEGDVNMVSFILSGHSFRTSLSTTVQLDLLHTCCTKGHLAVLKLLHSHGADLYGLRAPDNMRSPLHWAVQSRQVDIVRFLVEKGVAVNSQGQSSVSRQFKLNSTEALHHAADLQSEEILKMLLQAGANANALDRQHHTAMDRAIGYKNKRMVDMLIEHGFDTSQRDKENRTYLRLLADTF